MECGGSGERDCPGNEEIKTVFRRQNGKI